MRICHIHFVSAVLLTFTCCRAVLLKLCFFRFYGGEADARHVQATKHTFDATVGIHPSSAEEFVTMRSVTRTVEGQGSETP